MDIILERPIFLFLFLAIFILLCVIASTFIQVKLRATVIFRHLALVVRQNLPLSSAVYYSALSETGKTRRILRRMSRLLETGLPLSTALETAYPSCPALHLTIVRTAEGAGTLPSALAELNDRTIPFGEKGREEFQQRWAFLATISIVLLIVVFCVSYYVMPRLLSIFYDFNLSLPRLSHIIFSGLPFTRDDTPSLGNPDLGYLIVWGWVFFQVFISLFMLASRTRIVGTSAVFIVIRDFFQWNCWPFSRIAVAESCANSLPAMRLGMAAGWPLHEAVRQASVVYTNRFWQKRLARWQAQLVQGADPIESGRAVGLPDMYLRYLGIALRDGEVDGPLYQAEEYYAGLMRRWRSVLFSLMWPAATLILATQVALLALAIELAMKAIIDQWCSMVS